MTRKLFGTDGIRGRANEGNMTPEVAFRLGQALTSQARRRVKHQPRIVIGKDTRLSGYLFEYALCSGICAMGGKVMLTGPLPSMSSAHSAMSLWCAPQSVIVPPEYSHQYRKLKCVRSFTYGVFGACPSQKS